MKLFTDGSIFTANDANTLLWQGIIPANNQGEAEDIVALLRPTSLRPVLILRTDVMALILYTSTTTAGWMRYIGTGRIKGRSLHLGNGGTNSVLGSMTTIRGWTPNAVDGGQSGGNDGIRLEGDGLIAPMTGTYQISAGITYVGSSVKCYTYCSLAKNGEMIAHSLQPNDTVLSTNHVSAIAELNIGDRITVHGRHSLTGGGYSLYTQSGTNPFHRFSMSLIDS